ncbi:MAG: hypothetical protein IKM07_07715 [Clostridia bacterium]|nr:hypothetical protein [Clostridia bacterium]
MKTFYTPNDPECRAARDSAAIQKAVDLAHETGVNSVTIPRINERTGKAVWTIDEAIRLPSGMSVTLDNCFITMADDVMCNTFISQTLYTPEANDPACRLYNISIRGIGSAILDGGKPNDLSEPTSLKDGRPYVAVNSPIFFMNVEGFAVENISILNQRYWGMRFEFCSRGKIRDIFTNVCCDRRNQDGINLRNGCHDILIENVHGQTGDDTIALSAIDTNRNPAANYIVEGMSWDIHDVIIRNISGAAVNHPLVALRNHNGARIYNITIEDIQDTEFLQYTPKNRFERYGIIRIGNNSYYRIRPSEMGETYNITINNVHVSHSVRAIVTQATLKNCRFSNIQASGVCRSIVAVTPDGWAGAPAGVQIENLSVSGVTFQGMHRDETAVFDFSLMREGDYVKGLKLSDSTLENVGKIVDLASNCCDFELEQNGVQMRG